MQKIEIFTTFMLNIRKYCLSLQPRIQIINMTKTVD